MKLTPDDIKRVKALGFLFNRDSEDEFSARIITGNSVLSAEQLSAIADAARRFGNGKATLTARLTIEMPGVRYENIPALRECLSASGLSTGGTGDKIRPVAACKGTTCVFGQADTQGIAQMLHERFYEGWGAVTLPHKFKVAVGGCPNNCMKPDLNDFGLIGASVPAIDESLCRGCKVCAVEAGCQMGAPSLKGGKVTIDRQRCNACGKCIRACHFHCLTPCEQGLKVVLGGKWGRHRRPADALEGIWSVEQALTLLEKSLLVYRKHGYKKERFGDMIGRIGLSVVEQALLSDDILAERDAILAAEIASRP